MSHRSVYPCLEPLNIKIKQEKITPPSSPTLQEESTYYINVGLLKKNDEKKCVEPVKSSNEILAELFMVFNSAPPENFLQETKTKKSKKSQKEKTRKRKHKKKSRSSSDETSSDRGKHKVKHKKIKKEKKDKDYEQYHNQKKSKRKKDRNTLEEHSIYKRKKYTEESELDIEHGKQSSKTDEMSEKIGKIVIKNLKNSSIFAEAVKKSEIKNKDTKTPTDYYNDAELSETHSSNISLSDEETYIRSKDRYNNKSCSNYKDSYERNYVKFHEKNHNRYDNRQSHYRRYDADNRRRRSRSHSRKLESSNDKIDKKRLLEIARKNAISMLKKGTLPGTQSMAPETKEKVLTKMRYGGKSVDELTEFCKKLSNGSANGYLSNVSDDSDHDQEGNDKAFNHPFVLKDRGPIVMNIKNAIPIPPKSAEQTKAILMQFPVSSGQHHRLNENEWVPVQSKKATPPEKSTKVQNVQPMISSVTIAPETNVFPEPQSTQNLDVTSIITNRLNAMRKLQDNPLDQEALKLMYNTQKDMSAWANSKFVPGQFTGSTGANILTARELTSGFQAWAKRDQLISTAPLSGGMGMHLLQKMGWRPGEGLGKEKNGSLQPLLLEVKLDKKGLVAVEENPNAPKKKKICNVNQVKQSMENKHPVSLLGELAAKKKWGCPIFDTVVEGGPHHNRQFLFKVTMNGMVYQSTTLSNTKKEAKAVAARFALEQMGVL